MIVNNVKNNEDVDLVELIVERFSKVDSFTLYGVWKIVQQILDDTNSGKSIPSQMLYNYGAKQFIKNVDKKVAREEAIRWSTKYLTKVFS